MITVEGFEGTLFLKSSRLWYILKFPVSHRERCLSGFRGLVGVFTTESTLEKGVDVCGARGCEIRRNLAVQASAEVNLSSGVLRVWTSGSHCAGL